MTNKMSYTPYLRIFFTNIHFWFRLSCMGPHPLCIMLDGSQLLYCDHTHGNTQPTFLFDPATLVRPDAHACSSNHTIAYGIRALKPPVLLATVGLWKLIDCPRPTSQAAIGLQSSSNSHWIKNNGRTNAPTDCQVNTLTLGAWLNMMCPFKNGWYVTQTFGITSSRRFLRRLPNPPEMQVHLVTIVRNSVELRGDTQKCTLSSKAFISEKIVKNGRKGQIIAKNAKS